VCDRIRKAFVAAARGTEPGDARRVAMGQAYLELLNGRRELLLQLQAFAAAGDPKLRAAVREGFVGVMDEVGRLLGDKDAAGEFMARGMLLNVLTALDIRT
jgi:hypothetical protein